MHLSRLLFGRTVRKISRTAPPVLLALLLLFTLSNWWNAEHLRARLAESQCHKIASRACLRLEQVMGEQADTIELLAALWSATETRQRAQRFMLEAARRVRHEPSCLAITYVTPDGVIGPSARNGRAPAVTNLDLPDEVSGSGEPLLIGPVMQAPGQEILTLWQPISSLQEAGLPPRVEGFIAATFSLDCLVRSIVSDIDPEEFGIRIMVDGRHVWPLWPAPSGRTRVEARAACRLMDREWHVTVFPSARGSLDRLAGTNAALLGLHLAMLVTAGVALYLRGRALQQRTRERLLLEQRMQQAQKLESLGGLAGGTAHYINNVLTTILGNTELASQLLSPLHPAEVHLQESREAALKASGLCRQLLAYSGKGHFQVEDVCLNDVIGEMTQLLKVTVPGTTLLRYQLCPDLPAVRADAAQIRQIIMNLVTNAAEAIDETGGIITIATGRRLVTRRYLRETWLDENLPAGPYVFLEVTDNGCGMSEETRARLFDPFFSTKFIGRGLGLPAALGIVRGHHGAIKVRSRPGRGSAFRVLLPAVGRAADSPPGDPQLELPNPDAPRRPGRRHRHPATP